MVTTVLLLGFVLTATVTDFRQHKIYNWTTLPGILAGVIVSSVDPEGVGVEDSLLGLVGCGLIMVVCFLCFDDLGAGDVKLITMIGAFSGWYHGLECMLWTFVLGAALGVSRLIWYYGAGRLLWRSGQQLWWLLRYRVWFKSAEDSQLLKTKLYLAPAALVAVIIQRFELFQ